MTFSFKGLVVVCLGCLSLCAAPAAAQSDAALAFASPEKAAQHKAAFVRQVKARQLLRDPDWYYRYQVDVTKAAQLRRAGLDLAVLDKRAGAGTYQENLLYTSTVVKGRVSSQHYDERPEVYFHSSYDVEVDEVLAGQVPATVLTVRLRSGKMGDVFLHTSHEPTLQVGEQVLLYLNLIDATELAAAKAQGLWDYTNNAGPADFSLVEKYAVKADYLFDTDDQRVAKMRTAQANISRIVALLDKRNFYKKRFE